MFPTRILFLTICLALTACGTTPEERGISGAGIGASAGAVLGAVTGMSVLQGAVIGAAAGGLTGALTDETQINLGKPVWKSGSDNRVASRDAAYSGYNTGTVRKIQLNLDRLGYDPGVADGVAGSRTRAAIRAYQQDHGLTVDGAPSTSLAAHTQRQL